MDTSPPSPQTPDPNQPTRALIAIDLSAWPQVQAQLPATIPLALAITALETVLAQLRQLYAHLNASAHLNAYEAEITRGNPRI
jgi:hypothetical protein